MKSPQLQLTSHAKNALLNYLERLEPGTVATVLWATEGSSRGPDELEDKKIGPHWFVGFHNASRIPADWLVQIEGIPFVFDQGATSMRLDGATLDFADGAFRVSERAI